MNNSKLILLLKSFNKQEFKKLGKFVRSPYFIKERKCFPLLTALSNFYPAFDPEMVTSEKIYIRLFPGKSYGDSRSVSLLLTLSSDLYRMCKSFLAVLELESDEETAEHLLLEQLRKRKLNREYEREFSKALKRRTGFNSGSIDLYNNYRLHFSNGEYQKTQGNIPGVLSAFTESGESILAFGLVTAYKYNEIRTICENSYNIKPPHSFIIDLFENLNSRQLIERLRVNNDKYYPMLYANYLIYMISKQTDELKYMEELKTLLAQRLDDYGRTEKFILYSVLVSALIRLENTNYKIEHTKELFEVYNIMFQKGIYKFRDEDTLDVSFFRNIISVAFELRKLDWAEEFIHKASRELPEKLRDSMTNNSLANLYFLKEDFNKALGYINRVNFDYPLHKIDSKTLTFRIYYELGEYEHAISVLDTARQYLQKGTELASIFRERNLNFVKYSAELIRRKTTGNIRDIDLTLKKLAAEKAVELSGWLKRKFEEIQSING